MNTDGEGRRVSLHGRLMRDDLNSTLWGNFAQLNLKWNNETWGESCELIIVAEVRSEGTDVGRREKICAAWFVWECRTQMCHKIYVEVTQKSVRYFKSSSVNSTIGRDGLKLDGGEKVIPEQLFSIELRQMSPELSSETRWPVLQNPSGNGINLSVTFLLGLLRPG